MAKEKKKDSMLGTKGIARLISKDFVLKVVSLLISVALWYFVGGEDRVDKIVMVPIEIINLPRDLVISNQFKKEIEVTVSGPRSLILDMNNRAVTRQVDLSSASPGTMVIENDNEHIPVPRGITVQRVQPSSIILSLDKLIQKRFPVQARTVGKVENGYTVATIKTEPEMISITGPQTTLGQVDELFTKPINLDGMKKSSQIQVPLDLDPAIVELIGETSVTADLSVSLDTEIRSFDGMKVSLVVNGIEREVKPATVRVTASVPKLLLKKDLAPDEYLEVTAVKEENGTRYRVVVESKDKKELPVEIMTIVPTYVDLVGKIGSAIKPGMRTRTNNQDAKAQNSAAQPVTVEIKDTTEAKKAEPVLQSAAQARLPLSVLRREKSKKILDE